MSNQEFTHNNVVITLKPDGKFKASINDTVVTSSSLDAMKKKIDKAQVFESFPAFVKEYSSITTFDVVGVVRNPKRTGWCAPSHVWKCSDKKLREQVYDDTPDNRAGIAAYQAALKATEDEIARLREVNRQILNLVPVRKAETPK